MTDNFHHFWDLFITCNMSRGICKQMFGNSSWVWLYFVLGDPTLKEVCAVFVGGKRQNNKGFYYSVRHRSDVSVHKTNNTFLPSHSILYGRDLVCT